MVLRSSRGLKANIVVADDDQTMLDLMRHWLESFGYSVVEALDGQAAFDLLSDSTCDLLITDLAMPKMDGIELIQMVRTQSPDLRFLAISAKDQTGAGVLKAATTLGANDAISKPLEELNFIEIVEGMLK